MFSAIWDRLKCCRGPSTAARKRREPTVGMTELKNAMAKRGGVIIRSSPNKPWLVGERFLDFFDHIADLGRHGSLRLDAQIFLVFVECAGSVA